MKRIYHERLGRHLVVGGCRLPRHPHPALKLRDFVHAGTAFPASPPSRDWSAPAMSVIQNVEGNDSVGDCVLAEEAHFVGVVTGNAGSLYSYTAAQTLAAYSAITGYNPADPNTDQGTDPVVDLNYWTQNAYADGTKLAGWAMVDATNPDEVRYAINTFGNLKMWFGIPDSIANNIGSLSPGFVWDVSAGAPDANNGHCIGSCGYSPSAIQGVAVTADGVIVMTWGMMGLVTWAALASWFSAAGGGGLAVRVTTDWVSRASGQTPAGLAYPALVAAFDQLFSGSVPAPPAPPGPPLPPSPSPDPAPAPAPTSPPTLAQAQGATAAAFACAHPLMTRRQAQALAAEALAPLWPSS